MDDHDYLFRPQQSSNTSPPTQLFSDYQATSRAAASSALELFSDYQAWSCPTAVTAPATNGQPNSNYMGSGRAATLPTPASSGALNSEYLVSAAANTIPYPATTKHLLESNTITRVPAQTTTSQLFSRLQGNNSYRVQPEQPLTTTRQLFNECKESSTATNTVHNMPAQATTRQLFSDYQKNTPTTTEHYKPPPSTTRQLFNENQQSTTPCTTPWWNVVFGAPTSTVQHKPTQPLLSEYPRTTATTLPTTRQLVSDNQNSKNTTTSVPTTTAQLTAIPAEFRCPPTQSFGEQLSRTEKTSGVLSNGGGLSCESGKAGLGAELQNLVRPSSSTTTQTNTGVNFKLISFPATNVAVKAEPGLEVNTEPTLAVAPLKLGIRKDLFASSATDISTQENMVTKTPPSSSRKRKQENLEQSSSYNSLVASNLILPNTGVLESDHDYLTGPPSLPFLQLNRDLYGSPVTFSAPPSLPSSVKQSGKLPDLSGSASALPTTLFGSRVPDFTPPTTKTSPSKPQSRYQADGGREPLYVDPTLPPGWARQVSQRKSGATAGGWDTYITDPNGKRFRSRQEIKRHFERIGEMSLNYSDFDFNPFGSKGQLPSSNDNMQPPRQNLASFHLTYMPSTGDENPAQQWQGGWSAPPHNMESRTIKLSNGFGSIQSVAIPLQSRDNKAGQMSM